MFVGAIKPVQKDNVLEVETTAPKEIQQNPEWIYLGGHMSTGNEFPIDVVAYANRRVFRCSPLQDIAIQVRRNKLSPPENALVV
jgi:hypothetical protein